MESKSGLRPFSGEVMLAWNWLKKETKAVFSPDSLVDSIQVRTKVAIVRFSEGVVCFHTALSNYPK